MTFDYIDHATAANKPGTRMSVVSYVPSPWGEAAKNILTLKGIDCSLFRLDVQDKSQLDWTGETSAPVLFHNDEPRRSRWIDVLLFAENMNPEPPLLPADPMQRALAIGLSHELLGEGGLAWQRRQQTVHDGLNGRPGWPEPAAKYLGAKYGYSPQIGAAASDRIVALLTLFATRLKDQKATGQAYYIGNTMTCVDIYSATTCALFAPLPEEVCQMRPSSREVFETTPDKIRAALDPILIAHRDMMYDRHLTLPLTL